MEPEIELRLQDISKDKLIYLLRELADRHPVLRTEIASMLEEVSPLPHSAPEVDTNLDGEVTEDWDFNGDEFFLTHPFADVASSPGSVKQPARFDDYRQLLLQADNPQSVAEAVTALLEEAEGRAERQDYHGALDLYALLLDERLHERNPALTPIFDEAIDSASMAMEDVLCEASSNATFDLETVSLSPLLTSSVRHHWLERLFALWLKRLDAHSSEDDFPEIMLNVAWSEDIPLLRSLTLSELQKHPRGEQSNIVDFAQQYRVRAMEKFLRELPRC